MEGRGTGSDLALSPLNALPRVVVSHCVLDLSGTVVSSGLYRGLTIIESTDTGGIEMFSECIIMV